MSRTAEQYDALVSRLKQASLLSSCANVLGWDEQTYMPVGGVAHRAEQLSLLSGMAHDAATDPALGELIGELENSGDIGAEDSLRGVNLREARREYDRATCLPKRLVQELSRVSSLGQQAWIEARANDEFATFLPWLEQIVAMKREEAQAIGYSEEGEAYDALLDHYEPGATAAWVDDVFAPLRAETVSLLEDIIGSGREPEVEILERCYPIAAQRELGLEVAERIGFSFEKGRLDVAHHPFCSGFGPGDCRLTTRYNERHFPGAFFGTMHEAGHGIYEQGLDCSAYGTAMGESCSLGIHESQSRMWENFVGRGRPFWESQFPEVQQRFPEALEGVEIGAFVAAINGVRPSLIRVEADEVTYNLHIMLRFELERALVSGSLEAVDVPTAWNETFQRDFGLTPPGDADGCLQDIHWSSGSIGYFPTYALGNIYAAQFFDAADQAIGPLSEQFARGEFSPLKEWLNKEIHQRGRQYRANELVEVVTGQALSHEPLVKHLRERFGPLYGLS